MEGTVEEPTREELTTLGGIAQRVLKRPQDEEMGGTYRRDNIGQMVRFLKEKDPIVAEVWMDINDAVGIFNRLRAGEQIQNADSSVPLNYASDMVAAMGKHEIEKLPRLEEILGRARDDHAWRLMVDLAHVLKSTKNYQFLGDRKYSAQRAFFGEAPALYGKLLKYLHPALKIEKVFGGSTLEEMWAVMAINGDRRRSFDAVYDWYEEEEEGKDGRFSHRLVEEVKKLGPPPDDLWKENE